MIALISENLFLDVSVLKLRSVAVCLFGSLLLSFLCWFDSSRAWRTWASTMSSCLLSKSLLSCNFYLTMFMKWSWRWDWADELDSLCELQRETDIDSLISSIFLVLSKLVASFSKLTF